jgi:hypothetical protein
LPPVTEGETLREICKGDARGPGIATGRRRGQSQRHSPFNPVHLLGDECVPLTTSTRKPSDRSIAMAAGYYIREGVFLDATDDRLGRWYVGHEGEPFAPSGAGYPTRAAAWRAAAHMARARQDADLAT